MRILITAGPTREYFDSVRFLSNGSSGRMGHALAQTAARRGHHVTLVRGPVDLPSPKGIRVVPIVSAAQMLSACLREHHACDAAIFAAAVCDYRPAVALSRKPAKRTTGMALRLVPTRDIAATLGRRKGARFHLGFALEDHHGRAHAEQKLRRKRFDAIVLNSPAAINASASSVELLTSDGRWTSWPPLSKSRVALRLIRLLEQSISQSPRVARSRSAS